MSEVFSQKFLDRLRRSRAETGEPLDTVEELVRKARAAGHSGPLVVGPPRASLKQDSWRDDAKRLEENCPDEFGPPRLPASDSPGSLPAPLSAPVQELVAIAPGSPQSVSEVLPAPPPISSLPNSFWQALLFGSPDGLIPGCDVTGALRLISNKLRIPITQDETIGVLRAGQLRKMLRSRFGARDAERAMSELWRGAPASPGAPVPNDDQSHCCPGVWECPRSMPLWRREMNERNISERDWRIENGLWCGD